MKNKIYPFLLGLSCIVIVALVSFKNSEKATEKEQMAIMATNVNGKTYDIFISTVDHFEKERMNAKEAYDVQALLVKIQNYNKEGWVIMNSNQSNNMGTTTLYYWLQRDKQ